MKFIELTKPDGQSVFINMALIVSVIRDNAKNVTYLRDTAPIVPDVEDLHIVKETPDAIFERIRMLTREC